MRILIQPLDVGCIGKQRFDTFAKAKRVATRQRRGAELRIQPYRCESCNSFHVGEDIAHSRKRRSGVKRAQQLREEIEWT